MQWNRATAEATEPSDPANGALPLSFLGSEHLGRRISFLGGANTSQSPSHRAHHIAYKRCAAPSARFTNTDMRRVSTNNADTSDSSGRMQQAVTQGKVKFAYSATCTGCTKYFAPLGLRYRHRELDCVSHRIFTLTRGLDCIECGVSVCKSCSHIPLGHPYADGICKVFGRVFVEHPCYPRPCRLANDSSKRCCPQRVAEASLWRATLPPACKNG